MSAIRLTLKLLKEARGLDLNMEQIPLDDVKTYELIKSGDTIGCFQLESGGCRKLLQQLKPANLKEIMFATSLYRPGPIEGGMVQSFVARLHREEKIEYPHPLLENLLKDTFGIVLFQEQVMLIARDIAGFTLGEADVLRKAISKKDLTIWAEQRSKFVHGALANGLNASEANWIFDKLHKFAGYGFCKAHAAAYAYIAYITSYLKVHYPVEYLTSLFNVNLDFDCRIRQYLNQSRYNHIPILPPDINDSELLVTTDGEKIRMGFLMVKGLGHKAAEEILTVRQFGAFSSLADFCRRVDLSVIHKTVLESLIKAGAFDSFGSRIEILWSAVKIWTEVKEHQVTAGQLCCLPYQTQVIAFKSAVPELDLIEILRWEIETLGHPISGSPLSCLARQEEITLLNNLDMVTAKSIWVAGEITALRFRWTKKGHLVAFFTLEDTSGTAEITVFEPNVTKYKKHIFSGNIVKLKVKLEKKTNIHELFVEKIVPL